MMTLMHTDMNMYIFELILHIHTKQQVPCNNSKIVLVQVSILFLVQSYKIKCCYNTHTFTEIITLTIMRLHTILYINVL